MNLAEKWRKIHDIIQLHFIELSKGAQRQHYSYVIRSNVADDNSIFGTHDMHSNPITSAFISLVFIFVSYMRNYRLIVCVCVCAGAQRLPGQQTVRMNMAHRLKKKKTILIG